MINARLCSLMILGMSLVVPGAASADERARLSGDEEVPAVSSGGWGNFRARLRNNRIEYRLRYEKLEGEVTQAHIHFAQMGVNGGVAVFLCSNLGNGPAGTQGCPPAPAVITGTIRADDVLGPESQGLAAGDLSALIRAIEDELAYINVHTDKFPGGEVRGQID